jgi:hypothetical protein
VGRLEGDTRLLIARVAAFAFWLVCVVLVALPVSGGSSGSSGSQPPALQRPVEPPGPHPGAPVKQ